MRKIIVAGNWKMNLKFDEAKSLFESMNNADMNASRLEKVLIFPPYPYLKPLLDIKDNDALHLGAQNVSFEEKGAFTGEVSASMLSSLGIKYTLVGHSERRALFGETHEILKKKVDRALESGLTVVFCCGETLEQRESGTYKEAIEAQLVESLFHVSNAEAVKVIIAYEPVWAIGTGKTASTAQAEEMHKYIRGLFSEMYGVESADKLSILYGGSCNGANSIELFASENVDGGLIGGASLKVDEFSKIISNLNG